MEPGSADTKTVFKFSHWDTAFTWCGLIFFLADIVMDFSTLVTFYQEEAYWSFSVLLILILGSSVLANTYSWLWYSYDGFKRKMIVEKCMNGQLLHVVHVFQLGVFVRQAGVLEVPLFKCLKEKKEKKKELEGYAVYRNHDFCFLQFTETFSKNSPQLLLMLTTMLHRRQIQPIPVLKALVSNCGIALSVTTYHRSLRSFLPDKANQQVASSLVYFSWNLILISSRLVALALFASVLPCFIFTHFLCSWIVLFFVAWRCQTSFMDSPAGEWLFRATVGLFWYFNWFNVVKGRTRNRTLLYHGYMLVDVSLLCGLWCWTTSSESRLEKLTAVSAVVVVYILGLFLKLVYYKLFHPTLTKEERIPDVESPTEDGQVPDEEATAEEPEDTMSRCLRDSPTPSVENRSRMRKLAEIFYS